MSFFQTLLLIRWPRDLSSCSSMAAHSCQVIVMKWITSCMEFARRGFVTATISYRLGWNCTGTDFLSICLLCGNLYPNIKTATYAAAQDGRTAMRFIDSNKSNYKIDSNN